MGSAYRVELLDIWLCSVGVDTSRGIVLHCVLTQCSNPRSTLTHRVFANKSLVLMARHDGCLSLKLCHSD